MKKPTTLLLALYLSSSIITNTSDQQRNKPSLSSGLCSWICSSSAVVDTVVESSKKQGDGGTKSLTKVHVSNSASPQTLEKIQQEYQERLETAKNQFDQKLDQANKEHRYLLLLSRERQNKKHQEQLIKMKTAHQIKVNQYNNTTNHMLYIRDMIISEQSDRLDNATQLLKFFKVDKETLDKYVGFRPATNSDSEGSF